jgi:ATP-binding protein involved in chromosome partitioning
MSQITEDAVLEALKGVKDPAQGGDDIVSLKMVGAVQIEGDEVTVRIEFDERPSAARHGIEDEATDIVEAIEGVSACYIDSVVPVTAQPATAPGPAQRRPPEGEPAQGGSGPGQFSGPAPPQPLAGVKNIIAVASGKGGVGKSTVAVNLALGLKHRGHSVGLLDCDLYGPSAPILLGVNAQPKVKDGQLQPLEAGGIRVMSLGFLLDDDSPVIWRGPIVMGIVRQFLQDVNWQGLDYLVVDLPPGTGDTQLTLVQTVPITGAVVVTTPSELALADATRGLQMFSKVHVPVFGIVENMSYFECEECDTRNHIFGEGGGKRTADRLGVPFLGEIPIDTAVRKGGDAGRTVMLTDPESKSSAPFLAVADAIVDRTGARAGDGGDGEKPGGFLGGLFNR